ncbi:MAG TPA: hypothetical protein VFN92_05990 [Solirubrobacterales bacterium]|nr:hypothetical protein [Solirubrobacterales bacterium]
MTDDAIGDEISGAGGDVEHLNRSFQRLDLGHSEFRIGLDGNVLDRTLATGSRIDVLQQSHLLPKSSEQAHIPRAAGTRSLHGRIEPETAQTLLRAEDHLPVFVTDSERLVSTPLGIEDARKETPSPVGAWRTRPADQRANPVHALLRRRPYRPHRPVAVGSNQELEPLRADSLRGKEILSSVYCLSIGEGKAKAVVVASAPPGAEMGVRPDMTIAADHAAQITPSVVL